MASERKTLGPFNNVQVMNFLPHRYPFLFVDKITEVSVAMEGGKPKQVGTIVKGVKNATINEPYFTGHFPAMPITPGVILIETMAQVASFAVLPWVELDSEMRVKGSFDLRLAGVDAARFRKPVVPGDSVTVICEVKKQRGPLWSFSCRMETDGSVAAECDLLATVALGEK